MQVRQWTAISSDQLCWPTQFLHLSHLRFWLMACQTRQGFHPCPRCEQVGNFPSFCFWSRSCGSLWSSGQDLLEAFGRSSSFVEEQGSSVEGTLCTSSWKPRIPLFAIQQPLPLPWWLSCCEWQCSHSAFALQSKGEACLLTQSLARFPAVTAFVFWHAL